MIDRRSFFRRTFGMTAGLGATAAPDGNQNDRSPPVEHTERVDPTLAEYERALAATEHMDILGLPRSWWVVRQGFHPIAPERIVILRPGLHGWKNGYGVNEERARLVDEVRSRRLRWINTRTPGDDAVATHGYPLAKLDMIMRIIHALTIYYRVLEQFNSLAGTMAIREALGTTGIGRHLALLHDFQPRNKPARMPTANGVVDWWLFLAPEGMDWDSLDDQPVHVGLCAVFADVNQSGSETYLWVMTCISRVYREIEPAEAITLSRMGRVSAARWVNLRVAQVLSEQGG